ncbi:DUF1489 family protein [Phenylobacterium sp.]|uniref:DUF1489 family protein n=1 Tax=Phenylobacterium sp. TaxID=1871053 RepID=UPI00272F376C|nr:DUF1489 domain-containing protein [Phenylobacterium sp.]MDP1874028.1 DUF1489 domain-containing protein [Phenylobacterium sp.]MDP3299951.1 DUF1489 domain-containing protein [Phenylobacterium sp.]MDP3489366.1 DUF1489 domain-containing protein [Phenylobacterium sp.]
MTVHLIKLVVGCDTVEDLLDWRASQGTAGQPWILRTRQTPKRAAELTDGGSLYRVYKGAILTRQLILDVTTVGEGQDARCEMVLDETLVRVAPTPRRPFQGWRYLDIKDAPPDLGGDSGQETPPELARQLREAGLW